MWWVILDLKQCSSPLFVKKCDAHFYNKSKYSNRNLIKIGKELKIDIEEVFICGG